MRPLLSLLTIFFFFSLDAAEPFKLFQLGKKDDVLNLSSPLKSFSHSDSFFIQLNENIKSLKNSETVELILPEGFSVVAKKNKIKPSINGGVLWTGKILSDPNSYVVLILNNGKLVGEVFAGGKSYRINKDRQNKSRIFSVSLNRDRLQGDDTIEPQGLNANALVTETSTDNFVDIIIGYTAEAATNPSIEEEIEAWVAATNEMLSNSCVNFRYRLLSVINTGYATGTDDAYDIIAVLADPAGALSTLHTERENQGADLLHLIVDTDSIGLCGLANLGGISGQFYDDRGVGLTLYGCPSFVLAHEMGHNLSLRHDRYQQGLDLTDDAAAGGEHYGFVDMTNSYESIMSYQDHCIESGTFCERMDKFSSPRISHNGVPFGLDQFADNVDALNRSFPYVANYRDSQTAFDPEINANCSADSTDKDLHCFIATAAYGSSLHPRIDILRNFRDHFLKKFALGRFFIKTYYKYSPQWAHQIRKNPQWKTPIRWGIAGFIFFLQYFWILLFLSASYILLRKKFLPVIVLLLWFTPQISKADISISPYDLSLSPLNPSLSLDQGQKTLLGVAGHHLSASGEPNGFSEIKEAGTFFDIFLGYRSSDFSFTLRYVPEWEFTSKTTIQPFAEAEASEKQNLIVGDLSFPVWGLPLGLRVSQESLKTFNASQVQSGEMKKLSANLGSRLTFSQFLIGGGLIYQSGEKTDFLNSNQNIKTNWISLYAALGINFNASSGGSFGIEPSTDSSKGFQMELGYRRDPEVLNAENGSQILLPETSQIHALMQYLYPYGSNSYLMSLKYISVSQKSVENLLPDTSSFDKILAGFGYQTSLWSLTSDLYYQTEKQGFERNELGIRAALTVFFNGGGDSFQF